MRRIVVIGVGLLLLAALACSKKSGEARLIYSEDFEKESLGSEWRAEGGQWEIRGGTLHSTQAMNKDLVLEKALPKEGVIELDMISHSPQVDIKFRAWGDKSGAMHDGAYHFILGGWNNTISTLAPLGEHDPRRVEKRQALEKDRWYHVKTVRQNGKITMYLDGAEFLNYTDEEPLDPAKFAYFSFANWKTDCEFDNLKIYSFE